MLNNVKWQHCILLFQIFTCITDSLMPSFVESPPDVESLRVYLTLPLYHRFANLSNYISLQMPFCKAVLKLKAEACKVVGIWWSAASAYYFERLVRIYKSTVLRIVEQSTDKVTAHRNNCACDEYMQRLSKIVLRFSRISS